MSRLFCRIFELLLAAGGGVSLPEKTIPLRPCPFNCSFLLITILVISEPEKFAKIAPVTIMYGFTLRFPALV